MMLICIRLFNDGRKLLHSHPYLEYTNCVSVMLKGQRNDDRNNTVTQLVLEHISFYLPRQWATLVEKIRSYLGTIEDTRCW